MAKDPVFIDEKVPEKAMESANAAKVVTEEIYKALAENPEVKLAAVNKSGEEYDSSFRIKVFPVTEYNKASGKYEPKTFGKDNKPQFNISAEISLGKSEQVVINFSNLDSEGKVQPSSVKASLGYRQADGSFGHHDAFNAGITADTHFSANVKAAVETIAENSPKLSKALAEGKTNIAVKEALDAASLEPYSYGINSDTRFQDAANGNHAIVNISYNQVAEINAKTNQPNARAGEMIPNVSVTFYKEVDDNGKTKKVYDKPINIGIMADLADKAGLEGEIPSVAERLSDGALTAILAVKGADTTFAATMNKDQKDVALSFVDAVKQSIGDKADVVKVLNDMEKGISDKGKDNKQKNIEKE